MQPQGHVQVLTNQIDFGLNVQEAGVICPVAPRRRQRTDWRKNGEWRGTLKSTVVFPTKSVRELRKKGHDMRFDVGGYGGYQAIKLPMHNGQRVYVGASESRKDGQAAGY